MFASIFWKLLLLAFVFFNKALSESVLNHSRQISIGKFYNWEDCQLNSFANGFEIKADEEETNSGDEEGMTGLRLRCSNQKDEEVGLISSNTTTTGTWKGLQRCSTGEWLTGFSIKIDDYGFESKDDTAANNIEMKCNHSQILFNAGGNSKGTWTEWNECQNGEAICGIRTKVEDINTEDKVGLVAVQLKCCPFIPNDSNGMGEFPTSTSPSSNEISTTSISTRPVSIPTTPKP